MHLPFRSMVHTGVSWRTDAKKVHSASSHFSKFPPSSLVVIFPFRLAPHPLVGSSFSLEIPHCSDDLDHAFMYMLPTVVLN